MHTDSKPSERDDSRPPVSNLSNDADSASDSDSDSSLTPLDSAAETSQTEWLATGRQRRATAGNRMKSMLAVEEPDSDMELLFAEDDDDQGFSDAGGDGSDVQMDSSDEEDENNNRDGLEGEEELERQAREKRAAQRKRKAQDAIPAKFRKKVRTNQAAPASTPSVRSAPSAPAPRPKKKSERASWLPSVADMPTRASSRQTTRHSKEQLHQQMVEREARRMKQLAQMQKKAARLEALKKPPMTQEERLREAEVVEERNSKSLNRWEVAEKQREEERRAKLAALNERTLQGPVITFWSGRGVGGHIMMEEKPKKKKKEKVDSEKDKSKAVGIPGEKSEPSKEPGNTTKDGEAETSVATKAEPTSKQDQPDSAKTAAGASSTAPTPAESKPSGTAAAEGSQKPPTAEQQQATTSGDEPNKTPSPDDEPLEKPMKQEENSSDGQHRSSNPSAPTTNANPTSPTSQSTSALAPPTAAPLPAAPSSSSSPTNTSQPSEPRPSGVLVPPVLAPPPGMMANGVSSLGSTGSSPKSSVLAPPDTSRGSGPPPRHSAAPPPRPVEKAPTATATEGQTATTTGHDEKPAAPEPTVQPSQNDPVPDTKSPTIATPIEDHPPPPRPDPSSARNAIVFQNFSENAIRDKTIQTQIIFGRKMNRLAKPSPQPLCVITNHPARYRDPKTGLPYHNIYAYREIQRLRRGDYKWSGLLGAWVSTGTYAARGVPDRFLDADKARAVKAEKDRERQQRELENKKDKDEGGTQGDKEGDKEKEDTGAEAGSGTTSSKDTEATVKKEDDGGASGAGEVCEDKHQSPAAATTEAHPQPSTQSPVQSSKGAVAQPA